MGEGNWKRAKKRFKRRDSRKELKELIIITFQVFQVASAVFS